VSILCEQKHNVKILLKVKDKKKLELLLLIWNIINNSHLKTYKWSTKSQFIFWQFSSYSILQSFLSLLFRMHAQSYTRHQHNVEVCPHIKQMVFNLIRKLRFAIRVIQRIPQKVSAKEPSEHNCSNYIKFEQFMKYVCETVFLNRKSQISKWTHHLETQAFTNVEWAFSYLGQFILN